MNKLRSCLKVILYLPSKFFPPLLYSIWRVKNLNKVCGLFIYNPRKICTFTELSFIEICITSKCRPIKVGTLSKFDIYKISPNRVVFG